MMVVVAADPVRCPAGRLNILYSVLQDSLCSSNGFTLLIRTLNLAFHYNSLLFDGACFFEGLWRRGEHWGWREREGWGWGV